MKHQCIAIKRAAQELGLSVQQENDNSIILKVEKNGIYHLFIAGVPPLNSATVWQVARDKSLTVQMVRDVIAVPETLTILDPAPIQRFRECTTDSSIKHIVADVQHRFLLPVIVKKNTGSQGDNVFKCHTFDEIFSALTTIFNKNSCLYDHVALVQQCISIKREFRVVVLNKKIVFMYHEDTSQAVFVGNLSPLHWSGSRAILVEDDVLEKKLSEFIAPIFTKLNLLYGGLDIIEDTKGNLWLIEINTAPGFTHFIDSTGSVGEHVLVMLYRDILCLL